MGLDTTKPVFEDLGTAKVQTSLHICAIWPVPYYLLIVKFHIKTCSKRNISVLAEQAGFGMT